MESALFLSSPFYQPREHTVHPHAWLFGKSADVGLFFGSLFHLVPLSPFFLSLSTFYPFLHFPSSSYLSNTSSISPDAILGLVNSGSTQISVRGLFTRRLIISRRTIKASILRFLLFQLFINLSLSLSLFHRSVITILADTLGREGRNWVRSPLYLIFKYMIIKDGEKLINEPCAIIDEAEMRRNLSQSWNVRCDPSGETGLGNIARPP